MAGLTPDELRELRRLHVSAGRRVDSLFAGEYRSAVRGKGMEFEEVREYVPGDDVRLIDFDDAGFGWHLFELVTSLYFMTGEPY